MAWLLLVMLWGGNCGLSLFATAWAAAAVLRRVWGRSRAQHGHHALRQHVLLLCQACECKARMAGMGLLASCRRQRQFLIIFKCK